MKKKVIPLVLILAAAALGGYLIWSHTSPRGILQRELSLDLPRPVSASYQDDHGGSFGDGTAFGVLTFSQQQGEALQAELGENPAWKPLPLEGDLALLLYGGEQEGVSYGDGYAGAYAIPTVREGYYCFQDRLHDTHREDEVLTDSARNFTLALYDGAEHTLYYLSADT